MIWFVSICRCSPLRENTIMSYSKAYYDGADMVEMDVQLSKDLKAVIYHDFNLCTTSLTNDQKKKDQLVTMQLNNLTLKQLEDLKIRHVHQGVKVNVFYVATTYYLQGVAY